MKCWLCSYIILCNLFKLNRCTCCKTIHIPSLKALPSSTSVGRPGYCQSMYVCLYKLYLMTVKTWLQRNLPQGHQSPVIAVKNVDVHHGVFFISLLMVSMSPNVVLPLGPTPSTSMSSTVLVIWLSSLHLACPYQRSRFCIICVIIGSTQLPLSWSLHSYPHSTKQGFNLNSHLDKEAVRLSRVQPSFL